MLSSNGYFTRRALIGLVLGQFVSLLVTSTGLLSSELARRGIDAPTSQSFLNYLFLGIIYGCIVLYRRRPLQMKWYYYLVLGLVDVEANYLVVKAYQYTSMTSVMLLDCWSIPCVIILTSIFLKARYQIHKFIGVAICIVGLVLVVFSDVHAGDRAGGSAPVKGDVLIILGATLYAICNVSEEFVVKSADRVELMAMLGLFGAVVSSCQIIVFERIELQSIRWTKDAVMPFVGFAVAMFLFYSIVPILLKMSGSTMLNLSLLTSDMWAILIRTFAYYEQVDWIYYVAFVTVALGLVTYSRYISVLPNFVSNCKMKPTSEELTFQVRITVPLFECSGKKEDEETFQVGPKSDLEGKGSDEVMAPYEVSPVCVHQGEVGYQALQSEE